MITPEGVALGHCYDPTAVNSPCRQCESDAYDETGRFITVLDCVYDDDDE